MAINPLVEGKLRVSREGDRPSEDDIVREHFGPRGVKDDPGPNHLTPDRLKKTPPNVDPGHTA